MSVATVGSGSPTTAGQTIANLPFASGSTPNEPFGYALLTLGSTSTASGPDTLYTADSNQIVKYNLVGGSWTKEGAVTLTGADGLTANDANGIVTIYATTVSGIYALTDSSGIGGTLSGTPTQIGTAQANEDFDGIAFAPGTTIGSGTGTHAAADRSDDHPVPGRLSARLLRRDVKPDAADHRR